MLSGSEEATVVTTVATLNNQWLNALAQLRAIQAQYAVGGPYLGTRQAALDADGGEIAKLSSVYLLQARDGAISFDQWQNIASNVRADIEAQVTNIPDVGVLSGFTKGAADAAAAANKAGTGIGIGLGLGLFLLLALEFRR
jgi:hypothetical protein